MACSMDRVGQISPAQSAQATYPSRRHRAHRDGPDPVGRSLGCAGSIREIGSRSLQQRPHLKTRCGDGAGESASVGRDGAARSRRGRRRRSRSPIAGLCRSQVRVQWPMARSVHGWMSRRVHSWLWNERYRRLAAGSHRRFDARTRNDQFPTRLDRPARFRHAR